jgi:hypothetical protein
MNAALVIVRITSPTLDSRQSSPSYRPVAAKHMHAFETLGFLLVIGLCQAKRGDNSYLSEL